MVVFPDLIVQWRVWGYFCSKLLFFLAYFYPVLKLPCLFLLAIYFQATVLWREMKSLIASYGIRLLRKKSTFLFFLSGTFWWEMNFLPSASLIPSTFCALFHRLNCAWKAEVWEKSFLSWFYSCSDELSLPQWAHRESVLHVEWGCTVWQPFVQILEQCS